MDMKLSLAEFSAIFIESSRPFLLDGKNSNLNFSCFPFPASWKFHPSSRVGEALSALGYRFMRAFVGCAGSSAEHPCSPLGV